MTKDQLIQKLNKIKEATSIKNIKYHSITIVGSKLEFIREGKTEPEYIKIDELYELYSSENFPDTVTAKSYITGRVQSPSVAILNLINNLSNNISQPITLFSENKKVVQPLKSIFINKVKDEARFFRLFSELVGVKYILSKSIGKPINSTHLFVSNNFEDYEFEDAINQCYLEILELLKSDMIFSSNSLAQYIDGLILNHPKLGSRIIEFDEEQHFTPARKDSLKCLSKILKNSYFNFYLAICSDLNYLNGEVLSKHRIKGKLEKMPISFREFVEWLKSANEKDSKYIGEKNGFPFFGGRIAQRAYYDCLRDTAHLSRKNTSLTVPLRFSKKAFEEIEKKSFNKIPDESIQKIINRTLIEDYCINLYSA